MKFLSVLFFNNVSNTHLWVEPISHCHVKKNEDCHRSKEGFRGYNNNLTSGFN